MTETLRTPSSHATSRNRGCVRRRVRVRCTTRLEEYEAPTSSFVGGKSPAIEHRSEIWRSILATGCAANADGGTWEEIDNLGAVVGAVGSVFLVGSSSR